MPERDAVREAVLAAVRELRPWHPSGLPPRMGSHGYAAAWAKVEAALDTALAAVSRPAEARGEPVAWAVVGRDAGLMHTTGMREEAEAFRLQLAPSWADGDSWRVVPILYPAPSRDAAAPRPEPGEVSEAMVEAMRIIASEISDAIAAHDSGENVNAVERAKHVVAALAAREGA